jgi:hypothetical protein
MAYTKLRDIKNFWDIIGSSWGNFETKDTIESYWNTIGSAVDKLKIKAWELQLSKFLGYMPALLDDSDNFYSMIYSGINSTVLALPNGADLFEYRIDDDVISIPKLVRYYYNTSDIVLSGTYTENIDYTISGYNTIVWKRSSGYPVADPRYANGYIMALYAPHVYKFNPVLMNTWAKYIKFYRENFRNNKYVPFVRGTPTLSQKLEHTKFLIWALSYKKLQPPTTKILKDAFGISHGMPFAYSSGVLTSALIDGLYEVYVDGRTYVLPSGLQPVNSNTVEQFDIIASGVSLYDWVSGPSYVNTIIDNAWKQKKTLFFGINNIANNITYDKNYFGTYISGIMPAHFSWKIVVG